MQPPRGRMLRLFGACIAVLAVAGVYYFLDPLRVVWTPQCPFRLLTGWDCPACGSQRALHAALHGEFAAALRFNPFLAVSLPYLGLVVAGSRLKSAPRIARAAVRPTVVRCYLVLVIGWWIARNVWPI